MHKSGWLSRTDGWFGYSENLGLSSLKYTRKPSDLSAVLSPFYLVPSGKGSTTQVAVDHELDSGQGDKFTFTQIS